MIKLKKEEATKILEYNKTIQDLTEKQEYLQNQQWGVSTEKRRFKNALVKKYAKFEQDSIYKFKNALYVIMLNDDTWVDNSFTINIKFSYLYNKGPVVERHSQDEFEQLIKEGKWKKVPKENVIPLGKSARLKSILLLKTEKQHGNFYAAEISKKRFVVFQTNYFSSLTDEFIAHPIDFKACIKVPFAKESYLASNYGKACKINVLNVYGNKADLMADWLI